MESRNNSGDTTSITRRKLLQASGAGIFHKDTIDFQSAESIGKNLVVEVGVAYDTDANLKNPPHIDQFSAHTLSNSHGKLFVISINPNVTKLFEQNEDIDFRDNTCHVVLIDNTRLHSAGHAWVDVNGGAYNVYAGQCGVNAAFKVWVNNNILCNGDGATAFENTVIHEVGHTLGAGHSDGGVYIWGDDKVTPMLTWYSPNNCGSNDPVSNPCYGGETPDTVTYEI